jgi:glycosyltransferase involved in cell wall biosynthesis
MRTNVRRLLIISHVVHYDNCGVISAYGPYAREIDIWADLFDHVVVAAPCRNEAPPADALAFTRHNISIMAQLETGGETFSAKVVQALLAPVHLMKLIWTRAVSQVDAIHVRCPGNLGLLGAIVAPLLSRYIVAKYAGQWNGYATEPWTIWLQRFLLRSWWWRHGVVTVYGEWPNQPRQITPFFTSMMSLDQVVQAQRIAATKRLSSPGQLLYVGRLVELKNVDLLLRALRLLSNEGISYELSVVGDGHERCRLIELATRLGISEHCHFEGAVAYHQMAAWYEKAHVLVLPSKHSEGWPKAIAEAMCHGIVCIGTDHGLIPWLLSGRGHVVSVGDIEGLARCLKKALQDRDNYLRLSRAASSWAQAYSLEGLRESLRSLLAERWQTNRSLATNSF